MATKQDTTSQTATTVSKRATTTAPIKTTTRKDFFVDNKKGACTLCHEPDEETEHMNQCDDCDRWFHLECAKLSVLPTPDEAFLCIKCVLRPSTSNQKPSTSKMEEPATTGNNNRSLIQELVKALGKRCHDQ
ncbi:AGAP012541-PA [Anopheles gambiae str. PEST]|uniref:AGAP012541-PA n=1 Tax=Anopheles gambiae TaxID=7165 RepID=A0NAY0_ANOGA|nr:AGAP012541-PA [Anopheles gambiae str. PEST]